MKGLWLYLHFPQLQLDSLLAQQNAAEPSNNKQPAWVIVQQTQIIQLNQQAYSLGIKRGMSLAAAATLCPQLCVQPFEEKVETDKCIEIAECLYALTGDICLLTKTSLLLRIHTMLQLYGGLDAYWLALKQQLSRMRVTYRFATGTTPLAARILALHGWDCITENTEQIKQQLLHCALDLSELDPKSVSKLERVGIRQLKQLLNIPLADIAKRFSHQVADYLGKLTGELPHPVTFYHPREQFERYLELLYEISNSQRLIHPLKHLLKALEQFLKLREQVALNISITLHQRECEDLHLSVGAQRGEYRVVHWLRLIELQLESVSLQAPVFAITLSAAETHLHTPEKNDLFAGRQGELSQPQLIAILQAKLGEQAILRPMLQNDFRPEYASQLRLLSETSPTGSQQTLDTSRPMRPIFLLAQPKPLTEQVKIEHGPERIQTGWWDDAAVERDYFVARNQSGQWYWVFRTPKQDWFLHGIFS